MQNKTRFFRPSEKHHITLEHCAFCLYVVCTYFFAQIRHILLILQNEHNDLGSKSVEGSNASSDDGIFILFGQWNSQALNNSIIRNGNFLDISSLM